MMTDHWKRWRGTGVAVGVLAAVALQFALKGESSVVLRQPTETVQAPVALEPSVVRLLPAPGLATPSAPRSVVDAAPAPAEVFVAARAAPAEVFVASPPTSDYFRVSKEDAGLDEALPFGASIPIAHTPKEFEKIAFRAARECGMALDVVAVDCSEFPCLVWTTARNDNVARFSMEGCSPWESVFKEGTVVVGAISRDDGGAGDRYFSWMPALPDPHDQHIAMVRARERNEGMKQALGIR